MAKTLRLTVTFPMTIVVSSETCAELAADRKRIREMPAEKVAKLKGQPKANYELMMSERTDEELMEIIYRAGLRETIRSNIKSEVCSSESTCRIGDIKVTYEKPVEPKGSCQGCIYDDCKQESNRSANAGCAFKQTGIRSPHFETRFEKTV